MIKIKRGSAHGQVKTLWRRQRLQLKRMCDGRATVFKSSARRPQPAALYAPGQVAHKFPRWKFRLRIFAQEFVVFFFLLKTRKSDIKLYIAYISYCVFFCNCVVAGLCNIVSCALKYPSTYCMSFIVPHQGQNTSQST